MRDDADSMTYDTDLAGGSDPVLTRAAELGGFHLDAAETGKLFPFEWMRF